MLLHARTDDVVPVVVLKTVRDAFAHGRLGIARTLGRIGVPVHTLHESRWDPGYYSRYSAGRTLWPIGELEEGETLRRLVELGEHIGGRPVLVATDDDGALLVGKHLPLLERVYRIRQPELGLAESLSDKAELHRMCNELGVPTPRVAFPRDRGDVERFADDATFPVVVKAGDPRLLRARPEARSVSIARDRDELITRFCATEHESRPNVLLQEYIPGGPESGWMFNGYFDAESRCLAGFVGRKLRQYPPDTGMASLAVCHGNERIFADTVDFLGRVGYKGIVDLGWRYDARDGEYKLLDVNPRVGSTFRLFSSPRGDDVVRTMYFDVTGYFDVTRYFDVTGYFDRTGRRVVPAEAKEGRRWMVEPFDVWSAREMRRSRRLTAKDWWRSLRGVEELAWWSADDPAPFFAMSVRFALEAVRRTTGWAGRKSRRQPAATPRADCRPTIDWFGTQTGYWHDVYASDRLEGTIYRRRQGVVRDWVRALSVSAKGQDDIRACGAKALDVGCGAGLLSTELASLGYRVVALDANERMIRAAREGACASNPAPQGFVVADVSSLGVATGAFALVTALGVVPWVPDPSRALCELAEAAGAGGHVVFTIDNKWRMAHLLDPGWNPALRPLRRLVWLFVGAWPHRSGRRGRPSTRDAASERRYSRREVNRWLERAGLTTVRSATVGFGPFSLLQRVVLPDRWGHRADGILQELADRRWPLVRRLGNHHVVLARRVGVPDVPTRQAGGRTAGNGRRANGRRANGRRSRSVRSGDLVGSGHLLMLRLRPRTRGTRQVVREARTPTPRPHVEAR